MSLGDWIPATVVTGAWSFVLWHYKERIGAYLTRSVQHNFDVRLAEIQSEFRAKEAQFQADLRAKERQLDVLSSGALSALSSRQGALDKRRLEAVEQIWEAMHELTPARSTAMWMSILKTDAIADAADKNPTMREFLKSFGCSPDVVKGANEKANRARPFITPLSWAYFSAFLSIVSIAAVQSNLLQNGMKLPKLDTSSMFNLVKQVLPEHTDFIEKHGFIAAYHLLDEIEKRLLEELQVMVEGKARDEANIELAANILRAARKVEVDLEKSRSEQKTA
ncbi:hypothetical protein [Burkholderia cenocepacia]|uniref:hypothetical protein n=1 Tax=Burkholderia cenocepacia TaxID=95486 RepID=UPI000D0C2877|nr:hypothetical protein [Burkholderia cenocepacia]MDN7545070.1 hypothetical protein [Burkholderia cenocepacia]SOT39366.1 conserved hypothetical protein [Burkholderia cenocepacia]